MEIERKYLVLHLPGPLESYPCRILEQGYLNTSPVVRIRRDNDRYELTYKSAGLMSRQEYNLPLADKYLDYLMTLKQASSTLSSGSNLGDCSR